MNQLSLFDDFFNPTLPTPPVVQEVIVTPKAERSSSMEWIHEELPTEDLKSYSCYDWVTCSGERHLWWKNVPAWTRKQWQRLFEENAAGLHPDVIHEGQNAFRHFRTMAVGHGLQAMNGEKIIVAPSLHWVVSWGADLAQESLEYTKKRDSQI